MKTNRALLERKLKLEFVKIDVHKCLTQFYKFVKAEFFFQEFRDKKIDKKKMDLFSNETTTDKTDNVLLL